MRRMVDCPVLDPRNLTFSVQWPGTIEAVFDGDVEIGDAAIDNIDRRVKLQRTPYFGARCLIREG